IERLLGDDARAAGADRLARGAGKLRNGQRALAVRTGDFPVGPPGAGEHHALAVDALHLESRLRLGLRCAHALPRTQHTGRGPPRSAPVAAPAQPPAAARSGASSAERSVGGAAGSSPAAEGATGVVGSGSLAEPSGAAPAGLRFNASISGRSLRSESPNTSRNLRVVPNSCGRPTTSARPTTLTRPSSRRRLRVSPSETPRMASMSARMIGCL